ncbi:hypothetical protein [Duganella violaceipulchra]|uniref:Uncharacterized protein n=1 Tax=Duganella violaceipulchra TaxID=2849652 RepID=A0AA41KZD2_9BURK|nr:hypothetical protein [Duganella violaceicalia]MBV6320216.1 hypothetical protein [Duganella violaceicalia]MCP2011664.1 hypothetical protein [Duganella violaceicalia]
MHYGKIKHKIFPLKTGLLFLILFFHLFFSHAASARPPIWTKVEIISNDINLIHTARETIKISGGDSINIDDPKLKNQCDAVRAALPTKRVSCTAVLEQGNTYIYVVQIFTTVVTNKSVHCFNEKKLAADLTQLAKKIDEDSSRMLIDSESNIQGEFVTPKNVLSYRSEKRRTYSEGYHQHLQGRSTEIEVGGYSCKYQDRADAFRLLNYLGDPALIKRMVPLGIEDGEIIVRNNAFRLASTFSYLFDEKETIHLIDIACHNIDGENFFDLNKSLATLDSIIEINNGKKEQISHECLQRIKYLADISKTEQIGGYAKRILTKIQ